VKSCCHFCKIQGYHNRKSLTYYCSPKLPLDGTTTANGSPEFHTNEYDLYNMPMRNHGRHVLEARCVEELGPDSELGMTTGINGLPLILRLTTF